MPRLGLTRPSPRHSDDIPNRDRRRIPFPLILASPPLLFGALFLAPPWGLHRLAENGLPPGDGIAPYATLADWTAGTPVGDRLVGTCFRRGGSFAGARRCGGGTSAVPAEHPGTVADRRPAYERWLERVSERHDEYVRIGLGGDAAPVVRGRPGRCPSAPRSRPPR